MLKSPHDLLFHFEEEEIEISNNLPMVPGELETNHSHVMPGFKLLNPVQNDAALESQDKQTPQSVFPSSMAGQGSSNLGGFALAGSPEIDTLFF